jgi:hypothetical protein
MGNKDISGMVVASNASGSCNEKSDIDAQIEPLVVSKKRQSLSDIFTIVSASKASDRPNTECMRGKCD